MVPPCLFYFILLVLCEVDSPPPAPSPPSVYGGHVFSSLSSARIVGRDQGRRRRNAGREQGSGSSLGSGGGGRVWEGICLWGWRELGEAGQTALVQLGVRGKGLPQSGEIGKINCC